MKYPGGYFVSKSCVSSTSCKQTDINIIGLGFWITCCSNNNCNDANSINQKHSFVYIYSVLFILFFVFLLNK